MANPKNFHLVPTCQYYNELIDQQAKCVFYPVSSQSYEETIKKSRFIAMVEPVNSVQDIQSQLGKLYDLHPNANHIAYAYRIKTERGIVSRFNDAGEPSGTAGKPIYLHIEGKQLLNVLVTVTRYFGGIKLGAGGLTRAYGNSAKKVIEQAEFLAYVDYAYETIILAYSELQNFEYQVKKLQGEIITQQFTEQIELKVRIPADNLPALHTLLGR